MKLKLLEYLRCVRCLSTLRLEDPVVQRIDRLGEAHQEIFQGKLHCMGCGQRFPIRSGVPVLLVPDSNGVASQARTASSYGYLWIRSNGASGKGGHRVSHFERFSKGLSFGPPQGLGLDAGCGDGADLATLGRQEGIELIGVEFSAGGSQASFQRTVGFASCHIVQADLCRLPFEEGRFDFIYSYGVLHHLPLPERGLRELNRVLKAGAPVAAYLYEDFSDRSVPLRWLLRTVNRWRRVTPCLPHPLVYALCWLASPLIFCLFSVPFRILRRVPGAKGLANGLPFRHATGPFHLVGDLYDRFATPIEARFSRSSSMTLFQQVKLQGVKAVKDRGWLVMGTKPK